MSGPFPSHISVIDAQLLKGMLNQRITDFDCFLLFNLCIYKPLGTNRQSSLSFITHRIWWKPLSSYRRLLILFYTSGRIIASEGTIFWAEMVKSCLQNCSSSNICRLYTYGQLLTSILDSITDTVRIFLANQSIIIVRVENWYMKTKYRNRMDKRTSMKMSEKRGHCW